MEIINLLWYLPSVNPIPVNANPSAASDNASRWNTYERRIVAVEAALRSLAESGAPASAQLSHLVRELIDEFRGWKDGEIAAMKRAGAVALQCARVMDSMEKRLAAAGSAEEVAPLSARFASELERLRAVAYEHLSAALNREAARESSRFPVVFLN